MIDLTCWSCSSLETQPVLRSTLTAGGTCIELTLIVGTWASRPDAPALTVTLECYVDGAWQPQPEAATVTEVSPPSDAAAGDGFLADRDWLEANRRVADAQVKLDPSDPHYRSGNRYYQLMFGGLPTGALCRFAAVATASGPADTATARGALWLVAPEFDEADLRESRTTRAIPGPASRPLPGEHPAPAEAVLLDEQWWVLLVQLDRDGFDHVRLDVLHTDDVSSDPNNRAITPIRIGLDGSMVTVCQPEPLDWTDQAPDNYVWPVIDRSADSIVISRKHDPAHPLRAVQVITGSGDQHDDHVVSLEPANLDQDYGYRPAALVLLQYCIQGMNDLFAPPDMDYGQPRSYIEITFADEQGRYSSAPVGSDNSIQDGYRYALEAQRAYQVKTQWAFNAGVLTLLRYGLTDTQLDLLRDQVKSGLVSPSNAGFGAHRPPYYRAETNERELRLGDQVIQSVFGRGSDGTYYPDQRIYLASQGEVDTYRTLREQDELRYIVFDRSTVSSRALDVDVCLFTDGHGTGDDGNYLWREDATGLNVLLIEDELRNELLNESHEEITKGQLTYALRKRFMSAVRFRKPGPSKLYVYGDDLDHACGDGWFDDQLYNYTRGYLAALCWIRHHPWVRAWTVDEAGFDPTLYQPRRAIAVSSAICPSVDPGGAESVDRQGNTIHFNTWYQWWADTVSPWLDQPLREASDALEDQLISWPARHRNALYQLAWMYFLAGTHESMWNKQPVGPGTNPNDDARTWPPEDFVVSESVQQRHAWVYLNASLWASWADTASETATYVLGGAPSDDQAAGPLLDLVRAQHSADSYWPRQTAGDASYWDHDCLPTIVLYNRQALVVIDRNGGRITNVFCRSEGPGARPISVSGTLKAHQFLTPKSGPSGQIPCDGVRLQNTVFTPNHSYVATDVDQAAWLRGTFTDERAPDQLVSTWYPDNFNAYDCTVGTDDAATVVTCRYGPPVGEQPVLPVTAEQFDRVCRVDGSARRAGTPGVVWHDGDDFAKTICLSGDRIEIRYSGVRPGHVVANEFTVDLERAVLAGVGQHVTTDAAARRAVVENDDGVGVAVELGAACDFVPTVETAAGPDGAALPYDARHRVLTDDVRLTCAAGGAFGYDIVLPS